MSYKFSQFTATPSIPRGFKYDGEKIAVIVLGYRPKCDSNPGTTTLAKLNEIFDGKGSHLHGFVF